MRLFHGTNMDFNVIDIEKSQKHKDFGQGFYLTDLLTQAEELAKKKSRLFGGQPIVQVYEFDESCLTSSNLNVRIFSEPNAEWAEFIFKNRNKRIVIRETMNTNMDMILLLVLLLMMVWHICLDDMQRDRSLLKIWQESWSLND